MKVSDRKLKAKFLDQWEPFLDDVLLLFPEEDICPHELFVSFCGNVDRSRKKIVLISDGDTPVALACYRNAGTYWLPVTNYIVPGFLFPAQEGCVSHALVSSGLPIKAAWWRQNGAPPETPAIRELRATPTYGISCSDDFEAFWRKTDSFFKTIRNVRNRCKKFEFKVDAPNAAEWIIENWEAKWRADGGAKMLDLEDRLIAAQYLEKKGRHHTLSLFDGATQIGGITLLAHRNDLVAQVNYRNPAYNKDGVMTRLMDLSFSWAKEMGFTELDLGGSHEYKEKWAPENGKKWEFAIVPRTEAKGIFRLIQRARGRLKGLRNTSTWYDSNV